MDFQYSINTATRFVEERFTGTVNITDMIAALEQIFSDKAWDPHYNGIVDLTAADLNLPLSDMSLLIDFQEKHPLTSKSQWAFIAGKDLNFGLMRMFQGLAYELDLEVTVFRTKEEAMGWRAQFS